MCRHSRVKPQKREIQTIKINEQKEQKRNEKAFNWKEGVRVERCITTCTEAAIRPTANFQQVLWKSEDKERHFLNAKRRQLQTQNCLSVKISSKKDRKGRKKDIFRLTRLEKIYSSGLSQNK